MKRDGKRAIATRFDLAQKSFQEIKVVIEHQQEIWKTENKDRFYH